MSFTYKLNRLIRMLTGRRRPHTAAVILAGGSGSRMKSENGLTKQLMLLDGIPVLVRSVKAFDTCEYIDELVVVARKEEAASVALLLKEYGVKKPCRVVRGGETRRLSALRGLEAVSDKTKFIAIHDAARCLITPGMIADVVSAAYAHRAATAACAVVDTLKRVNSEGYIMETIDRNAVFRAQTPQVFECDLYRAAAYSIDKNAPETTDDNMLVEQLGQRIKVINVGEENIKLTTPMDLDLAECILRERKRREENG